MNMNVDESLLYKIIDLSNSPQDRLSLAGQFLEQWFATNQSGENNIRQLFNAKKISWICFEQCNLYYEAGSKNYSQGFLQFVNIVCSGLVRLLEECSQLALSDEILSAKLDDIPAYDKPLDSHFIYLTEFNAVGTYLKFYFEHDPKIEHQINTGNWPSHQLKQLTHYVNLFPGHHCVNVLDLTLTNGNYNFSSYVILPDYLVDVTTVAECFSYAGESPFKYINHLFHYEPHGLSLLIGTMVNDILDELIVNPQKSFKELFQNVFYKNPLAFCLLNNDEVIQFRDQCHRHFLSLQTIVNNRFDGKVQDLKTCIVEPSFYSRKFGLQGRLDVLSREDRNLIIELKSGKPFRPNSYGISPNHHAQTALYELILESVFGSQKENVAFILYSVLDKDQLKHSPDLAQMRREIIDQRNKIVLLHLSLLHSNSSIILENEKIAQDPHLEKFSKTKLEHLIHVYSAASPSSKSYFKSFCQFVAREQLQSKLGPSSGKSHGLSGLWKDAIEIKILNSSVFHSLKIKDLIAEPNEYPIVILEIESEQLSNFRIGDTLLFYKQDSNSGLSVLKQQVYKCTLLYRQSNEIHIRLRCKLFQENWSAESSLWNLEHDHLDKSYIHQYQSLFRFLAGPERTQNLILGKEKPHASQNKELHFSSHQSNVSQLLQSIIEARDYFLLWGPPGTGKTSIIIKALSQYYRQHTEESVLFLAYTNRAVDEICEAIGSNGELFSQQMIRIGSRYSTPEKFQINLLEHQSAECKTRNELLAKLSNTRLYTATLASILGKQELFFLKSFDTIIIDEASQIIESQLVGLLGHFKKWIMIGDHMQLPAVSIQPAKECSITDEHLVNLGFQSAQISMFERMYKNAEKNNWNQSYGILSKQGRMHSDIMKLADDLYYKGKLELMNPLHSSYQCQSLTQRYPMTIYSHPLLQSRTLFYSTAKNENKCSGKTNEYEATIIVKLIKEFLLLYKQNSMDWTIGTLGVITPFRAQIACIQRQLELAFDVLPELTIDTVERYQGGAREIIIISTVIEFPVQLAQIQSLNSDGVDRKLNVAITRAREHCIVLGNPQALSNSADYNSLMNHYSKLNLD